MKLNWQSTTGGWQAWAGTMRLTAWQPVAAKGTPPRYCFAFADRRSPTVYDSPEQAMLACEVAAVDYLQGAVAAFVGTLPAQPTPADA